MMKGVDRYIMSNAENRRIELGEIATKNVENLQDALSVLYAMPLLTSNQQADFVQNKYAELLQAEESDNNRLLNYQSIDRDTSLLLSAPKFVQEIYAFCQFCLLIRKNIKSVATMHLFFFSTVSFLFQIIPLLVIGKFYRKNVVLEFCNFKDYYLPEESSSIVRFFLKFADGVVVQSDRQCRTLKLKKIKAVSFKGRVQVENIEARVIENVQPKILVAANFESVFNANSVLKAFELVKQKYPRSELLFVGNGSQKNHIEKLLTSYSGVSLHTESEMAELFTQAEIFVHSYHIEYFAPEILTAMAHGLPVIASPIGMVDHLIQKENILVYQFNDYSRLADNLLLLIEDENLTKNISENSVQFIKTFSSNNKSNQISQFYQNL